MPALYFLLACLMVFAPLNSYSVKHLDHLTPFILSFFSSKDEHQKAFYFPAKQKDKNTLQKQIIH